MADQMQVAAVTADATAPAEQEAERAITSYTHLPATPSVFASREELLAFVAKFSLNNGFAAVTKQSNLARGQVWLRCDLGGSARPVVPANDPQRKRKRSSRQQNCPFLVYGRRTADNTWVLRALNEAHNHALAADLDDLAAHPLARRLTNAQKRLVVEMTDMGVRPGTIVEHLQQEFPGKPVKVRDIYNARMYIRRERLAGRAPYPEAFQEEEDRTANQATSSVELDHVDRSSRHGMVPSLQALVDSIQEKAPGWSNAKQAHFAEELQVLLSRFDAEPRGGMRPGHEEGARLALRRQ